MFKGGFSSFIINCMLIVFLKSTKEKLIEENKLENAPLSYYLLEFFQFWGFFNYRRKEVVMKNGGIIRNKRYPDNYFTILSPFQNGQNISQSCFKAHEIFRLFANRYHYLRDSKFSPNHGILKVLINPQNLDFNKTYLS